MSRQNEDIRMRTNTKTVLVCGGAGYIGSHVVRSLKSNGYEIVVLDDLSTGHIEAIPPTVEFRRGSIGNRKVLEEVFASRKIEVVIHLCANAYVGESVENPLKYYRNNISNALMLLEVMIAHNVRRMIFSSSCTVYGIPDELPVTEECRIHPASPYGHTKAMFEQILADCSHAYELSYCALRYFNAAGAHDTGAIGEDHDPETHLIPSVLKIAIVAEYPELFPSGNRQLEVFGNDYMTHDGTCMRDYIHVMDIAGAHLDALKYLYSGGNSVSLNLANKSGFTNLEIIKKCEEITGHHIPYSVVERRQGDADKLIGNSDKARRVIGWEPKSSDISNIISTAWNWHRKNPKGYQV